MPVDDGWHVLWREHPRIMRLLAWTFTGALFAAAALAWRGAEYRNEIAALRTGMSGIDKVKADLALASDARRLQVMMALAVGLPFGDPPTPAPPPAAPAGAL